MSPGPLPSQPDQRVHGDQRAGQEQHGTVHMAEEEQEAEGELVPPQGQLRRPGLGDAEEDEERCRRHKPNLL